MKNVLIIFLMFTLFACHNPKKESKKDVKSIESKMVTQQSTRLVDIFQNEEFENRKDIQFKAVENISIDLNNNNIVDSIKLSNCLGWNNEPGDFREIQVKLDNQNIFRLRNYDAWIKIPEKFNTGKYYNSNFLKIDIGFDNQALVFIGYNYASGPGFLTIITFDKDEPFIAFNKKYWLNKIEYTNSNHYNLVVTDSQNGRYTLYAKNGEILLEDI